MSCYLVTRNYVNDWVLDIHWETQLYLTAVYNLYIQQTVLISRWGFQQSH